MTEEAIKKIKAESAALSGGSLSRYESAVRSYVEDILCEFCRQEPEFAQSIVQSGKSKSFKGCLAATVKRADSAISDLEICKRAAEYYFAGAVVEFCMKIHMSRYDAENGGSEHGGILNLSLDDLL